MRAKNYVMWLDLQQRYRESDAVHTPDGHLASELRICMINLLREICANPQLEVPYEALFELSNQLEILHAGLKATYLLPKRFTTNIRTGPLYEDMRNTAATFLSTYEEGSVKRKWARAQVEKIFGVSGETVKNWERAQDSDDTLMLNIESGGDDEKEERKLKYLQATGAFFRGVEQEKDYQKDIAIQKDLGVYKP